MYKICPGFKDRIILVYLGVICNLILSPSKCNISKLIIAASSEDDSPEARLLYQSFTKRRPLAKLILSVRMSSTTEVITTQS